MVGKWFLPSAFLTWNNCIFLPALVGGKGKPRHYSIFRQWIRNREILNPIIKQLPLLLNSPHHIHVGSVFSPKRNNNYFPGDLSRRSPKKYNFINIDSHVVLLNAFSFESLAKRYPVKLSLSHYYPWFMIISVRTRNYCTGLVQGGFQGGGDRWWSGGAWVRGSVGRALSFWRWRDSPLVSRG